MGESVLRGGFRQFGDIVIQMDSQVEVRIEKRGTKDIILIGCF